MDEFAAFVERFGEQASEVIWLAACAWLERAGMKGRETISNRFHWYPDGELKQLRREIAGALALAHLACTLKAEDNDLVAALTRPAREEAARQGAARRRAQTLPAEHARLAKAAQRKAIREAAKAANGTKP